jgi:hypothetical protein
MIYDGLPPLVCQRSIRREGVSLIDPSAAGYAKTSPSFRGVAVGSPPRREREGERAREREREREIERGREGGVLLDGTVVKQYS